MKLTCTPEDLSPAHWRKSSYSGGGASNCVEVAVAGQILALRDSKNPGGPSLTFSPHQWRHFTAAMKTGCWRDGG
jgi:hypothetical protein